MSAALQFLWMSWLQTLAQPFFADLGKMAGDIADPHHPGAHARMMALRDQALYWLWGAGTVVIDPFLTLAGIIFTTFFVYLGARLLVDSLPERQTTATEPFAMSPRQGESPSAGGPVTYESALRIVCYATAPTLLAGIPLVGGVIASLASTLVAIIGAQEIYRTSLPRAIMIALFPRLLLFAVILSGFALLGIILLRLVSNFF
jgi:hypothetical protein